MWKMKLALTMVAALSLTVGVAATASAAALIKFSKTGNFATSTGPGMLEVSNGDNVDCERIETKGKVISEVAAIVLTLYVKCTSVDSSTCTSLGAPSGDIHVPHVLVLLGSDENPEIKMNPAVLLQATNPETGEPTGVEANCEVVGIGTKVSLHGSQICLIKNIPPTQIEVSCEKGSKAGEQKDKFFWDEKESGVENELLASATGIVKFTNLEASIVGAGRGEGEGVTIQIET